MRRTDGNQNRVLERRETAALTKLEFLLKVAGEIVMPRKLDGRTERRVGLHKHLSRRLASSRATSHLGQELKGPLTRTEVRHVECEIGVDDSDQRDIREMQTFRDHLGADEDV